jgi:methyltransferase (TIGR00027 family)
MKENQASYSAMITASIRAYHSMNDTPKIFDDFLAYRLIPQEVRALIEQGLTKYKQFDDPEHTASCSDQPIPWTALMQATNVLSRARYTEDALERAVRQEVKQYAILGAGMDTFAFRRPDLLEQLEVFEIDHPATQNFKLLRLADLGWEHPAQLHFKKYLRHCVPSPILPLRIVQLFSITSIPMHLFPKNRLRKCKRSRRFFKS